MEITTLLALNGGANCYLLKTDDGVFVIDPFCLTPKIEDFLSQNQPLPQFVLLTHCHYDHILGAKDIRDKFGAKVAIGAEDEQGLLNSAISLSAFVGLAQQPFSADITFSDNDTLCVGSTEIKVLHTPGHTCGSVCYIIGDCIFTGDTLFEGTIGRTDFPTGDNNALMLSLGKLKELRGDYKIYAGHGLATTLGREKRINPYML